MGALMNQEHFKALDEWAKQYSESEAAKNDRNPMIRKFGKSEGNKCKDCVHLFRVQHNTKYYLKCGVRGITRGAGTDHRAKWNACGKFEKQT
jgi:hypothetical protein